MVFKSKLTKLKLRNYKTLRGKHQVLEEGMNYYQIF